MSTRRHDDPEDFDGETRRTEVSATWGGKHVSVKGNMALMLIAVLAIIGSTLYAGWRTEQALTRALDGSQSEHRTLQAGQDRTSCLISMTFEERAKFRADYRPGAFRQWCPWISEN